MSETNMNVQQENDMVARERPVTAEMKNLSEEFERLIRFLDGARAQTGIVARTVADQAGGHDSMVGRVAGEVYPGLSMMDEDAVRDFFVRMKNTVGMSFKFSKDVNSAWPEEG